MTKSRCVQIVMKSGERLPMIFVEDAAGAIKGICAQVETILSVQHAGGGPGFLSISDGDLLRSSVRADEIAAVLLLDA